MAQHIVQGKINTLSLNKYFILYKQHLILMLFCKLLFLKESLVTTYCGCEIDTILVANYYFAQTQHLVFLNLLIHDRK